MLADEEPKYLRRQKPLEIKRRKFGRKAWKTYLRIALWTTAGVSAALAAGMCSHYLLSSTDMQLIRSDQVVLGGNHFVERASVLEVFAPDRGRSVLRIPLAERRRQLEAIPWVAQATVRRALPNTLQVDIVERTPIAFLRDGNTLSLIDAHGVILENPLHGDFHFPVATGIDAGMTKDDREMRMGLFAGFMQGIQSARAGAAEQISEVDLSDEHDLRAMVTGLQVGPSDGSADAFGAEATPLLVHFGDGDFQAKYQTLVEKIAEVRAKTGPLESVDLRFNGELVANPDRAAAPPAPKLLAKSVAKAPVKAAPKAVAVHRAKHVH